MGEQTSTEHRQVVGVERAAIPLGHREEAEVDGEPGDAAVDEPLRRRTVEVGRAHSAADARVFGDHLHRVRQPLRVPGERRRTEDDQAVAAPFHTGRDLGSGLGGSPQLRPGLRDRGTVDQGVPVRGGDGSSLDLIRRRPRRRRGAAGAQRDRQQQPGRRRDRVHPHRLSVSHPSGRGQGFRAARVKTRSGHAPSAWRAAPRRSAGCASASARHPRCVRARDAQPTGARASRPRRGC